VKIDLHGHGADSVLISTAATDSHGKALLSKNWSNNKVETIQPVTVTEEKVQPVAKVNVEATIAEAIKT